MNGVGIYRNGITEQQFGCQLSLAGNHLHLYLDNDKKDLLIWNLTNFHSYTLNGSLLIVAYGRAPYQTLECSGDIAGRIHKGWIQKHTSVQTEQASSRKTYRGLMIFLLALIALAIFILFFGVPWLGEKAANLVPVDTEIKIGNSLSAIYEEEGRHNDSTDHYIQAFVDHLELDNTYDIRVKALQSDEINAFALPGGKIFVYSGIIKKMHSYEELAALLGHEVTHVVNRHSLKSICRSAATGIVVASVFGDISGISAGIISQAEQFKQLDYSRDLETEADENGIRIMVENHIDPKGMLNLLRLLKAESKEEPGLMKYLSTHPDTDSRIADAEANPLIKNRFPENKTLKEIFQKLKAHLN